MSESRKLLHKELGINPAWETINHMSPGDTVVIDDKFADSHEMDVEEFGEVLGNLGYPESKLDEEGESKPARKKTNEVLYDKVKQGATHYEVTMTDKGYEILIVTGNDQELQRLSREEKTSEVKIVRDRLYRDYDIYEPGYADIRVPRALLTCNEQIPRKPAFEKVDIEGYLIGAGNGGIWTMLEALEEDPIGVLSIDLDPKVTLSGLVLARIAKDIQVPMEALEIMYGFGKHKDFEEMRRYTELAISELEEEGHSTFASKMRAYFKHQWDDTLPRIRYSGEFDEFVGERLQEIRSYTGLKPGRIDVPASIYINWERICRLAKADRLIFLHADLSDERFLSLIEEATGASRKRNLIYLSNVVDLKCLRHVKELDRIINSAGLSTYVYCPTNVRNDGLAVVQSQKAPVYGEDWM